MADDDGHEWRIGIDEAGYGPNLGPLVVAATAWRVPRGTANLYDTLADAITSQPKRTDPRLHIADSKVVYKPGGGLAALERSVFASCGSPTRWSELVERLKADPRQARTELLWHSGFDLSLPIDTSPFDIATAAALLSTSLEAAEVVGPRLAARLVFPAEFNQLVAKHGTKGAALSHVSIGLASRLLDEVGPSGEAPATITFDKHGGRNRYGDLLQEHFPEDGITVLEEGRPASHYRQGERLAFTFRTKGEAEMPVALASMTAKLLRELAMRALNAFWAGHVAGLRPTAGYPVDAKRFKAEIAAKQAQLGIPNHVLWRER